MFFYRKLYQLFSHAYSSKQLLVPVDFVLRLCAHASKYELFEDCKYYNIKVSEDQQSLHFQKSDFKEDLPVLKCKQEKFVNVKIKNIYLPEILLLKRI